jgi:hypothetical protein
MPLPISASVPTQIPTSASAVQAFTDPAGGGAYATFRVPRGNYKVTLYANPSSANQIILTVTGPSGSTTTTITLPQALSFGACSRHGVQLASIDSKVLAEEVIANLFCCRCLEDLGYILGGLAVIFFAMSGLGLIIEVGELGGIAAVFGGGVGASGFAAETFGRFKIELGANP